MEGKLDYQNPMPEENFELYTTPISYMYPWQLDICLTPQSHSPSFPAFPLGPLAPSCPDLPFLPGNPRGPIGPLFPGGHT